MRPTVLIVVHQTPLMMAVHSGKVDCVKFLISKGANVNAKTNDDGTTALLIASGNPQVTAILRAAGATDKHIDLLRASGAME